MTIPIIEDHQIIDTLNAKKNPYFSDYYAFYSSWYGGILVNPSLMLLPIDDHIVHRGDGVFEAFKVINRSVYLLEEHLQRLWASAKKIDLELPFSLEVIRNIILDTLRAADKNEAMVRVYVSRGPGNFNANPYDSLGAQLCVAVTRLSGPPQDHRNHGVAIGQSKLLAKPPWQAQVKSCNYLLNVLMKKEAVDRGLDFVIGLDHRGVVTESATENVMIVDHKGAIVYPELDTILRGTTMLRACELARQNGLTTTERNFTINDLESASEVMMAGTTLDILPVTKFENRVIGEGKPGAVAKKLLQYLMEDIQSGDRGTAY